MESFGRSPLAFLRKTLLILISLLVHTPTTRISCVETDLTLYRVYVSERRTGLLQTDPCGLQLFHLLSHTDGSGGASLLVDGFYVAATLKAHHPELYTLLSTIPIPAHAAGDEETIYQASPKSGYPVLNHDPVTKELYQVRWNNDDRSVMDHLGPDIVEKWYGKSGSGLLTPCVLTGALAVGMKRSGLGTGY